MAELGGEAKPEITATAAAASAWGLRHKVRADVQFTAASGRVATSINDGFLRCRPRRVPSYTG